MKYHGERQAANAESKSKAEHDGEPWSTDEIAFLMDEFEAAKGACDDEAVVAECLGRTIEACRQRFYEVRAGRARVVTTTTGVSITRTTVAYIGHADDPEDQWWSPGYYNNPEGNGSHA